MSNSFHEQFFETVKKSSRAGQAFESFLPFINVKTGSGKCKLRGMQFDCRDLCKFVLKDGRYTPYIFCEKLQDEGVKVVNCFPFLCVGVAEMLAMYHNYECNVFSMFDSSYDLSTYVKRKSTSEWGELYYEFSEGSGKELCNLMLSLRRGYTGVTRDYVNQLASMLFVRGYVSPRYFCDVFFDVAHFATFFITVFLSKKLDKVGVVSMTGDKISSDTKMPFEEEMIHRGGITYEVPNEGDKKNTITDCRGIGISLFCILATELFSRFGEYSSKSLRAGIYDDKEVILAYQNEVIADCIGNDVAGKYMKLGRIKQGYEPHSVYSSYSAFIDDQIMKDENLYAREVYEEELLFRSAYSIKYVGGNFLRNISMHYTNSWTLLAVFGSVGLGCCSDVKDDREALDKEYRQKKQALSTELNTLKQKLARQDEALERLRVENEELLSNKDENGMKELLDSKNKTIEKLVAENKQLNQRLRSFYLEEDEDDIAKGVDFKDIIEFLNGFKIVTVGMGIPEQRLQEIGLKGVGSIIELGDIRGTVLNADFLVIVTGHIPHKLVFGVKERYKELYADGRVLYYNGTNPQGFARACYDYISSWIGG